MKTLRNDNDELAYLTKASKLKFQYHNSEFLKLNKDYQVGITRTRTTPKRHGQVLNILKAEIKLKTLRKDNDELAYLTKAAKLKFQYHNSKFLKLNKDYQVGITRTRPKRLRQEHTSLSLETTG